MVESPTASTGHVREDTFIGEFTLFGNIQPKVHEVA
jgi:hypothetical protein